MFKLLNSCTHLGIEVALVLRLLDLPSSLDLVFLQVVLRELTFIFYPSHSHFDRFYSEHVFFTISSLFSYLSLLFLDSVGWFNVFIMRQIQVLINLVIFMEISSLENEPKCHIQPQDGWMSVIPLVLLAPCYHWASVVAQLIKKSS